MKDETTVHLSPDTEARALNDIALRAISALAMEHRPKLPINADWFVREFLIATRANDTTRVDRLLDKAKLSGATDEDIVEGFIPAAARRLGQEWSDDKMDFATVSIGSARLQGMLRYLGPDWCKETIVDACQETDGLIVVPEGEQHTLGSFILAGQLRKRGMNIQLAVDCSKSQLESLLKQRCYDAVMISASLRLSLEFLSGFVKVAKARKKDQVVLIGGNVLDQNGDICQATNADYATSRLEDVLEINRIKKTADDAAIARQRLMKLGKSSKLRDTSL